MRPRLLVFDLDGTVTHHRTPIEPTTYDCLASLIPQYKLLMLGAGTCERIHRQIGKLPIDILSNYGMEEAVYDETLCGMRTIRYECFPIDRASVEARILAFREAHALPVLYGEGLIAYRTGAFTLPVLGSETPLEKKLTYDPDRKKRVSLLPDLIARFPDYTVTLSGTSSFDFCPFPYSKYYALDRYAREHGYAHGEIRFFGNEFFRGGNDESVFLSDIPSVAVEDFRDLPYLLSRALEE